MPILGFGVFQIPPDETEKAVTDALAAGYRHIDTAAAYVNEEAVGRAIAAGDIARDDIFVTTKVWAQDCGEEDTKQAVDTSLRNLGLDYLDLYLIHQPLRRLLRLLARHARPQRAGRHQGHRRRELLRADRLVDLIVSTGITPAVNQIETHPFYQRADYQEPHGRARRAAPVVGRLRGREEQTSSPTRR